MKGKFCIYTDKPLFCQEVCSNCQIFQNWQKRMEAQFNKKLDKAVKCEATGKK